MRTKALLLAAAFAAVGVATSVAQVYSVNAVGYVNVTLKPGFNLVANPLDSANNTIGQLAKNIKDGVPNGTRVFKFKPAPVNAFVDAQYDDADGAYLPLTVGLEVIAPGEGFFIFNNKLRNGNVANDLTLTFVGQVMQGTALANPLPKGFSIKSNIVPQQGKASDFGLPGQNGDRYFQWDAVNQKYNDWQYDDADLNWLGSIPGNLPVLKVGEAFLLLRAQTAGTWTRSFNVNTP